MKNSLPLFIAVAIGGLFYLAGTAMTTQADRHPPLQISVSAEASVNSAPDIATLSFGVQTGRAPTSEAAIDNLTKSIDKIIAAVKAKGVEEKDIGTENFWMNPAYDYVNGTQVARGFEATQSLRVTVRDLKKVGEVLTAATAAGANQAGNVQFSIDDPDQLREEARTMAIEKAKEKAKVLAGTLGKRLVGIVGFSESGDGSIPVPMMARNEGMAGGGGDMALSIPAGEQEIVSFVTLTYEIQ